MHENDNASDQGDGRSLVDIALAAAFPPMDVPVAAPASKSVEAKLNGGAGSVINDRSIRVSPDFDELSRVARMRVAFLVRRRRK